MAQEIHLQILLENLTRGFDFGLQEGSRSNYKTVQLQRSGVGDLYFKVKARVRKSDRSSPNFTGAWIQGTPGKRFIYIDIGTYAGQVESTWSRRLKISLDTITWAMIEELSLNDELMLQCKVEGTANDGGPNCGTVKPFQGWHLVKK